MNHSLLTNLITFLFIYPLSINSALSSNLDKETITNQLQKGLNEKNLVLLKELFTKESFDLFQKKYLNFARKYKEAKWTIKKSGNDPTKKYLDIKIVSERNLDGQIYNLNSNQIIEFKTYKNKIKDYKVISEESILKSYNSGLNIKINSPNKVLTGERYEINLIIEEPLDNSLIASGMIALQESGFNDISQKYYGIKAYTSGGIFKYIQAPLKPGFQTISALIAHPKGIYSITKKIEVALPNDRPNFSN